jgi:hypothetical protein
MIIISRIYDFEQLETLRFLTDASTVYQAAVNYTKSIVTMSPILAEEYWRFVSSIPIVNVGRLVTFEIRYNDVMNDAVIDNIIDGDNLLIAEFKSHHDKFMVEMKSYIDSHLSLLLAVFEVKNKSANLINLKKCCYCCCRSLIILVFVLVAAVVTAAIAGRMSERYTVSIKLHSFNGNEIHLTSGTEQQVELTDISSCIVMNITEQKALETFKDTYWPQQLPMYLEKFKLFQICS